MATTTSIPVIFQKIAGAQAAASTGKVPWTGVGGEKEILDSITSTLLARGIIPVPDLTALAALDGNSAQLALVTGLGIYKWNPVTAAWVLAMPFTGKQVTTAGAGQAVYTITHPFNTDTPSVTVYKETNGATPFPLEQIFTGTVKVIDADTISVTFSTATTFNSLVVIRN